MRNNDFFTLTKSRDESINERVRKYRKLANLTQGETAERLGMKVSTYSQMERKGTITAQMIIDLADIFEVSPYILLNGESPYSRPPLEPVINIARQPDPVNPFLKNDEPPLILSNIERSIIKIMRTLPKSEKDEILKLIHEKNMKNK